MQTNKQGYTRTPGTRDCKEIGRPIEVLRLFTVYSGENEIIDIVRNATQHIEKVRLQDIW